MIVQAEVTADAKDQPQAWLLGQLAEQRKAESIVLLQYRAYNRSVRCDIHSPVDYIEPMSYVASTSPDDRRLLRSQDPEDWLVGLLRPTAEFLGLKPIDEQNPLPSWSRVQEVLPAANMPATKLPVELTQDAAAFRCRLSPAEGSVVNQWLARGDGVAAYHDPGQNSSKFVSFGSDSATIKESLPPPEISNQSGETGPVWSLVALYRGSPL
jgi:hypothetical protein